MVSEVGCVDEVSVTDVAWVVDTVLIASRRAVAPIEQIAWTDIRTASPQVWRPVKPWGGGVVQLPGVRIVVGDVVGLVDLRDNCSLNGKPEFIGERFGIQTTVRGAVGVASVNATGNEDLLQVGITRVRGWVAEWIPLATFQIAQDVPHVSLGCVGIWLGVARRTIIIRMLIAFDLETRLTKVTSKTSTLVRPQLV
jgi:hypothetical protein